MQNGLQNEVLASLANKKNKPVILCVDDHIEVLDSLEQQLSVYFENKYGKIFRIMKAESGSEGLEILEDLKESNREIVVIVSDQVMPGMPGDEFLIQAHKMLPTAKKIMLTGQAQRANVGNAINNAKLYRYLEKPWDATDLQLTVEEAAASYYQSQTIEERNRALRLLHNSTQVISMQTEISSLLYEVLTVMMEFSKADKAHLVILNAENELIIEATGTAGAYVPSVSLVNIPIQDTDEYPYRLIEFVARARNGVVLHNAAAEGNFTDIAYFNKYNVKSVAVVPVVNKNKLIGIFYLEYNGATQFFTDDKAEIFEILATSAAIAIENAYLVENMQDVAITQTQELSQTFEDLQIANQKKDEMIKIVSHDIRSPLTGVANLAVLLQDKDVASDTAQVVKYAGIMNGSVQSVLRFVNDILDLAKLESGTIELNKVSTDLNAYLKNIITGFEPLTLTKDVKLSLQSNAEVSIAVDRTKIGQAFNNLIGNSIKFTPKGGNVTVTLGKVNDAGKEKAQIIISDSGIGIPKEDLPNIFEKFGKHQRTGTKGEKGTGLGMSIAKETVELHNGTINVESEVGKGTTFTILLPME